MDIERINRILRKFAEKTTGVEDAVLLSNVFRLLTNSMGEWDEVLATTLAAWAFHSMNELSSDRIDQIWLHTENGYLVGIRCSGETFLLVKASKEAQLGLLEVQINQALKTLEPALKAEESFDAEEPDNNGSASETVSPKRPRRTVRGIEED